MGSAGHLGLFAGGDQCRGSGRPEGVVGVAVDAGLVRCRRGSPVAPGSSGTPSLLGGDIIPDLVVSPGTGSLATRVIDGVTLGELGSGFPFGPGFGVERHDRHGRVERRRHG